MPERNVIKWLLVSAGLTLCGTLLFTRYELVLRVKKTVDVTLRSELPAHVSLNQRIDVKLDEQLKAMAALEQLEVPLDETLTIPLDLDLQIPISAEVRVDKPLPIVLDVPIRTVLSEKELGKLTFEVPLDTDVFVDDTVVIDTVIPLDTHVKTALGITVPVKAEVPIHLRVPIHQKVHLKDRVHVAIDKFRFPLNTTIHVDTQVPLDKSLAVRGVAHARVKQSVRVPLKQTLHPTVRGEVPVSVRVQGTVPAEIHGEITTSVRVDHAVPTQLGAIRVSFGDMALEKK